MIVDNFIVFKKLMIKRYFFIISNIRNKELELEAMKEMDNGDKKGGKDKKEDA